MNIVFWNMARTKYDKEETLAQDIDGLVNYRSADLIVLCECLDGTEHMLSRTTIDGGFQVRPARALDPRSDYRNANVLRYVTVARPGLDVDLELIGGPATVKRKYSRPALAIRWGRPRKRPVVAIHGPSVSSHVYKQLEAMKTALRDSRTHYRTTPVFVFGDLNVNVDKPDLYRKFLTDLTGPWGERLAARPTAAATHWSTEKKRWDGRLDWGLGVATPSRMIIVEAVINQTDVTAGPNVQLGDRDDEFVPPFGGTKGSDHRPIWVSIPG